MKTTTLASLLLTSAAAGAGAAAAGGPIWFAYTQPFSYTAQCWTQLNSNTWVIDFPVTTADAIVTDIHCDYFDNTPGTFQVLVNGLPAYTFTAASGVTATGCCGPYGPSHHLQHGFPVPCGAVVRIQSNNISGDTGFNISGYFL